VAFTLPLVPTQRAAWIIAAFAPIALVIAAVSPGLWVIAPITAVALVVLIVLDGLMAGSCEEWHVIAPADTEVGQATALDVHARFSRSSASGPEAALEFDPRLAPSGRATVTLLNDPETGARSGSVDVHPDRRGAAEISGAWLRWSGPLGLGARQTREALDKELRIWPDLSPVRSKELQTFMRDAATGLIARRIRGEGTQFEALAEYQPGMDRRKIDWKASARHTHLYARENESERNNQIVFAFDCGQAMCEPVDGMPRIDRAVTAALTCSYVALKGGDKVSLFGFAQRPQVMTPFVNDSRAFHRLQSAAAALDYDTAEPNFTLALATLTDKHLVLFVTIADSELEGFVDQEPGDIATLARSVTADTLLHQRSVVLQRLRRMGVDVIEAPYEQIGYQLIDRYFIIKNSEAIG